MASEKSRAQYVLPDIDIDEPESEEYKASTLFTRHKAKTDVKQPDGRESNPLKSISPPKNSSVPKLPSVSVNIIISDPHVESSHLPSSSSKQGISSAHKTAAVSTADALKAPHGVAPSISDPSNSKVEQMIPLEPKTSLRQRPQGSSSITCIIVNTRQKGNPVLKHIRNIAWEFGDIVPDYQVGRTSCALYLSLRYHHMKPDYIHERLRLLGKMFELRVLLVQVDVKDPHSTIKELAKIAILADCTLLLAWSHEEAGRYLETLKVYENKPPDAIMEKTDQDFHSQVTDFFVTVKSVNKTDVLTLLKAFGSVAKILQADKAQFELLPGFGALKAKNLYDAIHQPLIVPVDARTSQIHK